MNKYPVVSITLKDIIGDTFDKGYDNLRMELFRLCGKFEFLLKSDRVTSTDKDIIGSIIGKNASQTVEIVSLQTLCSALHSHYGVPAVLLIDEYDVPIIQALTHGYYQDMLKIVYGLLSRALKSSEHTMISILTGCLGFSKNSISTGLNNVNTYNLSHFDYSDSFGFTNEEVDYMLSKAGLSDKKNEVKEWYDGYTFGNINNIYCPWGISKYISDHISNRDAKPETYWANTSENNIARGFFNQSSNTVEKDLEKLFDGKCIVATLNLNLRHEELYEDAANFWTLLYLTGYLTKASLDDIHRCNTTVKDNETALVIPNKEIAIVFETQAEHWFNSFIDTNGYTNIASAFWSGKVERLKELLDNLMMNTLSYMDHQEFVYHIMLLYVFKEKFEVLSNRQSGHGRYDIAVFKDTQAAIIEVKRCDEEEELEEMANKALKQINTKKYYADLIVGRKLTKIRCWGMAFCKKTCKLVTETMYPFRGWR